MKDFSVILKEPNKRKSIKESSFALGLAGIWILSVIVMNTSWWGVIIGVGVSVILAWSGMRRPIALGLGKVSKRRPATPADLIVQAHKHSFKNRNEIERSTLCGCFYCEKNFVPTEIVAWVDEDQTATCPFCGMDSVLGNFSGFELKKEFLHSMNEHWFAL